MTYIETLRALKEKTAELGRDLRFAAADFDGYRPEFTALHAEAIKIFKKLDAMIREQPRKA
jgi:hypothetical protein